MSSMTRTGSACGPNACAAKAASGAGRNQWTALRSIRRSGQRRHQAGHPGTAGEHQPVRLQRLTADDHPHAVGANLPPVDRHAVAHVGAVGARGVQQRGDAAGGEQHASPRLGHRDRPGRDAHGGMPSRHLRRVEHLVRQAVRPCARERAADEAPLGRTDRQPAGRHQQGAAGAVLERLPRRVGPLHQRHVQRMLEVGLTDDPRAAL